MFTTALSAKKKEASHVTILHFAQMCNLSVQNVLLTLWAINVKTDALQPAITSHTLKRKLLSDCGACDCGSFFAPLQRIALQGFANIDGVVALTHGTGCGMDHSGLGMQLLRRTLAGYATHANFAGVLVGGWM
jgi:hypothetical protein